MVTCELCGSQTTKLVKTKIAGSFVNTCQKCSNMGQVEVEQRSSHTFRRKTKDQTSEDVVSNYLEKIKRALDARGFDLHQLARAINIKESSLNKYYSGKIKLDIETARKLEKFFEITLIEEVGPTNVNDYIQEESDDNSLNLGDLIKKQLKEKNGNN